MAQFFQRFHGTASHGSSSQVIIARLAICSVSISKFSIGSPRSFNADWVTNLATGVAISMCSVTCVGATCSMTGTGVAEGKPRQFRYLVHDGTCRNVHDLVLNRLKKFFWRLLDTSHIQLLELNDRYVSNLFKCAAARAQNLLFCSDPF